MPQPVVGCPPLFRQKTVNKVNAIFAVTIFPEQSCGKVFVHNKVESTLNPVRIELADL